MNQIFKIDKYLSKFFIVINADLNLMMPIFYFSPFYLFLIIISLFIYIYIIIIIIIIVIINKNLYTINWWQTLANNTTIELSNKN